METVVKDFTHIYFFEGTEYQFKGKKKETDIKFVETLIKLGKLQYKKVFDYTI
jgi:hypothetical protein